MTQPDDAACALDYYRAGLEKRRPEWVPSRVFLRLPVRSDLPWERNYVADRGEHDCESNEWGAISVLAKNGKMLGVKPAEFEPLQWRRNGTPQATCLDDADLSHL